MPDAPVGPGQRLVMTGGLPQLGNWDPAAGVVLACGADQLWRGAVQLPIGRMVQTKVRGLCVPFVPVAFCCITFHAVVLVVGGASPVLAVVTTNVVINNQVGGSAGV